MNKNLNVDLSVTSKSMVYFYEHQFSSSLHLNVDNLGLLRGYSAFEYLRTYNRRPFCLKAHLARFFYSMEKIGLTSPYTPEELETITHQLIGHEPSECGIKWIATGGRSIDGLRYNNDCQLFGFTQAINPLPESLYIQGIKTATLKEKRPVPEAKTTAYLPASHYLSAHKELHEVIYLNPSNELLEAATSNLFLVKNNTIYTADTDVLHGITREVVLHLAKDRYDIVLKKVKYDELADFEEVFITATNKEIMPVSMIDQIRFKVGPVTQNLRKLFILMREEQNLNYTPLLYQTDDLLKT